MADLKGGTIGILLAVFGIILTIYGWFWIPNIADMLPIGLLKGFFWFGLVCTWLLAFVVTPYMYIIGGNGSLVGVIKGCLTFFAGTFGAVVSYYVIPAIIDVGEEIFSANTDLKPIGWMMMMVLWTIIMIILPAYFITKDMEMKRSEN